MSTTESKPEVFEYLDYRAYLKDYYSSMKHKNPSYSFRVFARRAKLGSENYLKLVMDNKRRITDKNMPHFLMGLNLSNYEAEYFESLVRMNDCDDPMIKSALMDEVLRARTRRLKTRVTLTTDQEEVLKFWHHWAIREMVELSDFSADPHKISKRLRGSVSPAQCEDSINLLLRLNLIQKVGSRFVVTDQLLKTQDEVSSLLIKKLHQQMCLLGLESLYADPLSEREISGLTIALSKGEVVNFKTDIKKFCREMNLKYSQSGQNKDNVYQLEVLLFSLTKDIK